MDYDYFDNVIDYDYIDFSSNVIDYDYIDFSSNVIDYDYVIVIVIMSTITITDCNYPMSDSIELILLPPHTPPHIVPQMICSELLYDNNVGSTRYSK